MKPFDKALRETVFELVRTGVRGHLINGDTYGVWLVRDQVDTTFPMESWSQRHNVELGAKATAHVKKNGYKGKSRLDIAFADALRIAKRVGDLTIILVSNGETPIAGTAFDAAINERLRHLAPEMKKVKATLNTSFVARDGEIVAWAANATDVLAAVPSVPIKPKPVATSQTNAPTISNSSSGTVVSHALTVTNAEQAKPRILSKPIIITRETVADERRMYQSLTIIGSSNDPGRTVVTNSLTEQTNLVRSTPSAVPLASSITNAGQPKLLTTATNRIQLSNIVNVPGEQLTKNVVLAEEEPESNKSEVVVAATPKMASAEAPPTQERIHPILWAGMGASTALVVVLAFFIVSRSRRPEPSLISQSIGFDRVHAPKI